MEVIRYIIINISFFTLLSCSNSTELETGEIKALKLIKEVISQPKSPNAYINSRHLLTRKEIDASAVPVLFVELESGQNGTLTQYPGEGIGQTWLGADGATITMNRGILKASRGMGNDLMGATSLMPSWNDVENSADYERKFSHLNGNNQIITQKFTCGITKIENEHTLSIWEANFTVNKYKENCLALSKNNFQRISNTYYVDSAQIVRKSFQYHSKEIGYISTERLDR